MAQKMMNSDTGGMHLPRASEHLETAWHWLCERRQHAPAQADVWHLRHHWAVQQQRLLATLLAGEYRLSPMLIVGPKGEQKALWRAQDALVLKWVALQIAPQLPLHARCEHIKGHEGGPASVRKMSAALKQAGYRWVLRTDVKGYYASIDKAQLLGQVRRHITHPVLLGLITQYVHYTVEDGGTFHTPEKGISRSCPLSPLMGALYLQEMDTHFGQEAEKGTMYYARYMDDIVVLTHSRWQLRKHVRILNRLLSEKTLCQHPDKTFIGRTVKGFDWMGAWLEPQGVTDIAPRAKANHCEKVRRLYERAWRWREPKAVTQRKVSNYRWRWTIWAGTLVGTSLLTTIAHAGWSGTGATVRGDCVPVKAFTHQPPFSGQGGAGDVQGKMGVEYGTRGTRITQDTLTCNGQTYYGAFLGSGSGAVLAFVKNMNISGPTEQAPYVRTNAVGQGDWHADDPTELWLPYMRHATSYWMTGHGTAVAQYAELWLVASSDKVTYNSDVVGSYTDVLRAYGGYLENWPTSYSTITATVSWDLRTKPKCDISATANIWMTIREGSDSSTPSEVTATVTCYNPHSIAGMTNPATVFISLAPSGGSKILTKWQLASKESDKVWVTASATSQTSNDCSNSNGTSPGSLLPFDGSHLAGGQTYIGGESPQTEQTKLYFQACSNGASPGSYTAQTTLSLVIN